MKFTKPLFGLLLFLLNARIALANLPGSDALWGPIGDVIVMIIPTYQGNIAHAVDVIILFFLVAYTAYAATEKSKLPKQTRWIAGITLWLGISVPLVMSGALLFNQIFFAYAGFVMLMLVIIRLSADLIDGLSTNVPKGAKYSIAVAFGLLGSGSVFAAIAQSPAVNYGTGGSYLQDFAAASSSLATILLIVGGTILFNYWKTEPDMKNEKKQWKKLRQNANKEEKQRKKLKLQQEHEKKHYEYLRRLEGQFFDTINKLRELDHKDLEAVEQMKEYIESMLTYSKQYEQQMESYFDWMKQNNASLNIELIGQLRQIANQWVERLQNLKHLFEQQHANVQSVNEEQLQNLETALEKELKEYHTLEEKTREILDKIRERSEKIMTFSDTVTNETSRSSILQNILKASPALNAIYSQVLKIRQKDKEIEQQVRKLEDQMNETETDIERIILQWNEALATFKESTKKSVERYKELEEKLETIIKEIPYTPEFSKRNLPHEITTKFERLKTNVLSELQEVKHREKALEIVVKHQQQAKRLLDAYNEEYNQELKEIDVENVYSSHLETLDGLLADLSSRLQEFQKEFDKELISDKGQILETLRSTLKNFQSTIPDALSKFDANNRNIMIAKFNESFDQIIAYYTTMWEQKKKNNAPNSLDDDIKNLDKGMPQ